MLINFLMFFRSGFKMGWKGWDGDGRKCEKEGKVLFKQVCLIY